MEAMLLSQSKKKEDFLVNVDFRYKNTRVFEKILGNIILYIILKPVYTKI